MHNAESLKMRVANERQSGWYSRYLVFIPKTCQENKIRVYYSHGVS